MTTSPLADFVADRVRTEVLAEPLARVERETRHAFGAVQSGLRTRQHHPSYGVTKASLLADFNRAIGLAQACAVLTGSGTTDSAGFAYAEQALGIDVREIAREIRTS